MHDELAQHLLEPRQRAIGADEPALAIARRHRAQSLGWSVGVDLGRLVGAVQRVGGERGIVLESDDATPDVVALTADDDARPCHVYPRNLSLVCPSCRV